MPKGNYTTPEILHDAPLDAGDKFDFHFDDYAATIARLTASKKTKTPLAICVSGAWGSGKTTLLRRVKIMLDKTASLKKETEPQILEFASENEYPKDLYRYCRTVWFNAWKYSDEQELLVALIRVIIQNMAEDGLTNKAMGKLLDPTYPRRDVVNTVLSWFKVKLTENTEVQLSTGEPIPTKLSEKTAVLDLFDDAFDKLMAVWVHRRLNAKKINPQNGVLVVFIDDLDRCLPAKMVQVLEAVKLFLDKRGCVFILGADTGIVQQAIVKHYEDAGVTGESAKDYLDKIVQLRFELPPIIQSNMQDYLEKQGVIGADWGDSWKLLILSANVNPRSVKALANDINLQWSMLVNLGQATGINRVDFNAWQVLMRIAPANFVRHIRVRLYTAEQRHKYILDAISWAKGEYESEGVVRASSGISLADKFNDYSDDYRLRRVLQEITFSKDFTPEVLNAFMHLIAPPNMLTTVSRKSKDAELLQKLGNFGIVADNVYIASADGNVSEIIRGNKKQFQERKLKVFISHAAADKNKVRSLHKNLSNKFEVWIDEENLMPGQDWQREISKAIRNSDVILICLSKFSETSEGYVQKELKMALDISEQLPEGDIYIIPVRLEECSIPQSLMKYQWVDIFGDRENLGYEKLLRALRVRADSLGIEVEIDDVTETQT